MRTILAALAISLTAHAGQLDLAVVQFPEVKTAEALNAALAGVKLSEITNADRTMTSESYLKGGYVSFAQSFPTTPRFASSTRISNLKADVDGRLTSSHITVRITLSEGVNAGLRRFSSRTFAADAPLAPGQPRVLAIRQVTGKVHSAIKGQATVQETQFCVVIIGQETR